jgi:hypothetical protein
MDVNTTFLNGVIEEETCIDKPEGFEVHNREFYVCRLRRVLYRIKKAPCSWYNRINNYFLGMGFTKSEADSNLYYILVKGEPLILVLYVDDLFMIGSEKLIEDFKRDLVVEFEMKDLGMMHYFLGLEVWNKDGNIFLGHKKYVVEILKRFDMQDCKPMETPMVTNWKKIDSSMS